MLQEVRRSLNENIIETAILPVPADGDFGGSHQFRQGLHRELCALDRVESGGFGTSPFQRPPRRTTPSGVSREGCDVVTVRSNS